MNQEKNKRHLICLLAFTVYMYGIQIAMIPPRLVMPKGTYRIVYETSAPGRMPTDVIQKKHKKSNIKVKSKTYELIKAMLE